MISREKASRGFCALPVLRESRVFLFFSFLLLLLFFFFWFRLTLEGTGDLIEIVGGQNSRKKKEEERKLEPKCVSICKGGEMKRLWFITWFISKLVGWSSFSSAYVKERFLRLLRL